MTLSLQYSDLDAPGYTRRRCGRGFSYLYPEGRLIKDKSVRNYCRSLVIPPAWQSVWISQVRDSHILCTGIDSKSRKQYLYHPEWNSYRNQIKFDTLVEFGRRLAGLREAVASDLGKPRFSRRRIVAAAVRLIDCGLVRVGNAEYNKTNNTFGATTLLTKHVSQCSNQIVLRFKGKSNKQREIELEDPALVRSLFYCQELPGQRLFQYENSRGDVQAVTSSDVNDYLQTVSGIDISAKDFRTWGGTVAAWTWADENRSVSGNSAVSDAGKYVAHRLGNTPAVAKKYYIHPAIQQHILDGNLPARAARARKRLNRDETSVLQLLESL